MAIRTSALGTSAGNIYVSSGNSAITTIHICNYSSIAQTVNVYIVPSGFTANSQNIIYSNLSVSAYNTQIVYAEKFILGNNDSIQANVSNASTTSVTVSSIGI
ncbi:MAG: hypothetical protein EBU08_06470 [Micrococcales bacterium]|jgi:hypothetical protein|nr:hypothetical protein [Micrococcales bacterium]